MLLKIIVHDLFAERSQGETHQPKVHLAPWDADNGDAEQQAEAEVGEGNPEPTNEEPEDIHEEAETATVLVFVNDM